MDKRIEKKKWTVKTISLYSGGGLLLIFLGYLLLTGANKKTLKVDNKRFTTSEVIFDSFSDIIPVTGTVEPIKTIFIDAQEGGTVDEIFAEEGEFVKKGQPLLRLSNTNLMLDFMNRETQIVEQINQLRNMRINLEQTERNNANQLLEIEQQLENLDRKFKNDSILFTQQVIASNDYKETKTNYVFLKKRQKVLKDASKKDEEFRKAQLDRINHSIDLMERNLLAISKYLENLTVKAPIDGQLTRFVAELGETKNKGSNIGQINVLSGYKISANIDEHYISKVENGQKGFFSFSGKQYELEIFKIFPQVNNGQFKIELKFSQNTPETVRNGQTYQIKLELSQPKKSLMVKAGGFYNKTGGNWVFVLNENGKATKRNVKMGRQNPDYIEVISGLSEGEKIISSSYESFGDAEELIFENKN